MPKFCAVNGCSNRSHREKNKSYFRVPKVVTHKGENFKKLTEQRRRTWIKNLHPHSRSAESDHARVCSDHFVNGCPSAVKDVNSPDWAPTIHLGYQRDKPVTEASRRYKETNSEARETCANAAEALQDLGTAQASHRALLEPLTVYGRNILGTLWFSQATYAPSTLYQPRVAGNTLTSNRLELEPSYPQELEDGSEAAAAKEAMASLSCTERKASKKILGKSRFDTSLGFLTRRFAEMLRHSADGVLDLNIVSKELDAPKRRVYDVTNVLEGIQLIKKKSKNHVEWLGDSVKGHLARELKALIEEERKLDELIQSCTWQVQQMCENQYSQRFAYLTYDDVQRIPSLKGQTVIVIKAPAETKLEVPHPEESLQVHLRSTQGPIEVFICSDNPIPTESTDSCVASCNLINPQTHRNSSAPFLSSSPSSQVFSKDNCNHTSGIGTIPLTQPKQHSSAAAVSYVSPTSISHQPLPEDPQSFVTLSPPLNLSLDGEYLLSLAEDEGITELFSTVDLEKLPVDMPV